jgi:hypothetical protein
MFPPWHAPSGKPLDGAVVLFVGYPFLIWERLGLIATASPNSANWVARLPQKPGLCGRSLFPATGALPLWFPEIHPHIIVLIAFVMHIAPVRGRIDAVFRVTP